METHTYRLTYADSPSALTKGPDVKAREIGKKKKTVTHYLVEGHFNNYKKSLRYTYICTLRIQSYY